MLVRYDSADPERVRDDDRALARLDRGDEAAAAAEEEVTAAFRRASRRSTGPGPRASGTRASRSRCARRATPRRSWSRPDHVWSRREVLDWLLAAADEAPTLFGFDFSFAPPIVERGAYLPGETAVPERRQGLLGLCRCICARTRISAQRASSRPRHRRHFYFGAADGAKARFPPPPRLRACVQRHRRRQGLDALRRDRRGAGRQGELRRHAAAPPARRAACRSGRWTRFPAHGSLVVEIYTRAFIRLAGLSAAARSASRAQLDAALAAFGSRPARLAPRAERP